MDNDYISRKELIEWLMLYAHFDELVDPEDLLADIRAMKAADVVPVVHGKWIRKVENDGYAMSLCSACSFPVHIYWGESKFCPSCGAKMDKED